MKKSFIVWITLILVTLPLQAAVFKNVGIKEGLSHPFVRSICQDDLGRMWFATAEGITEYDAHEINVYKGFVNMPNGKSIWIGNYIESLDADETTGLLFFISHFDLYLVNLHTNIITKLTDNQKTTLFSVCQGKLWYINNNQLFVYHLDTKTTELKKKLPQAHYVGFKALPNAIYLGTDTYLYQYSPQLEEQQRYLVPFVVSIYQSRDGELWFGSDEKGIYRGVNGKVEPLIYHKNTLKGRIYTRVRCFEEDNYGNVWIGTEAGLLRYNKQTQTFQDEISVNMGGVENSSIYSLHIDNQENLWIGTYGKGVFYFNLKESGAFHYDYFARLDHHNPICFNAIDLDENNNLWLATEGEGVICLNKQWKVTLHFHTGSLQPLLDNRVKSVYVDSAHKLVFMGSYQGGLSVYDIKHNTMRYFSVPVPKGLTKKYSSVLHIVPYNGEIYVASLRSMFRFNYYTGTFTHLGEFAMNCSNFCFTSNGLCAVIQKNDIHLFSPSHPEQIQRVNLLQQGYSGEIVSLLPSGDGLYIFTMGSGILYYNVQTQKITAYNTQNSSLPTNYCYKADTLGNDLVFTCDLGVVYFDTQNEQFKLLHTTSDNTTLISEYGIKVTPQHDILIADAKGIQCVQKHHFNSVSSANYQLYFTQLYVNNKYISYSKDQQIIQSSLYYGTKINLKANQNNFMLHFSCSDYENQNLGVIYAYRLKGLDKYWNYTTVPQLNYAYLPAGNYTLQVKIANRDDSPMLSMPVHVSSPLYARWWAILLYIVVSASIIISFYRYRMRQRQLAQSLQNQRFENEKIKQLNDEKLKFFTNVSHEFRTPLTLINSYLDQLLTSVKSPDKSLLIITKLQKNTNYMNNLVSELLDFRKYSQQDFTLQLAEYNFNQFLDDIYHNFTQLAVQKHIKFTLHPIRTTLYGWFDCKNMEKVFYNILSNAFKFTQPDGEITISVSGNYTEVTVSVTDTGSGISTEHLPRLFDQFYQVGKDSVKGTGIGLALTKNIVERHHGQISVASTPGQGSTFKVTIPLQRDAYKADTHVTYIDDVATQTMLNLKPQLEDIQTATPAPLNDASAPDNALHLLLVEDNEELLTILKQLFQDQFSVSCARNGQEALDMALQDPPHLIISDVMMPKMSGTQLCLQLKNNIKLCHIPIILLTALSGEEQTLEGLNRGADCYISKPFNVQLLRATVNNLLHNRQLIHRQLSNQPLAEVNLSTMHSQDQELLQRTEEILMANVSNIDFSVTQLGEELGMSRSLLYSKFKAISGMHPNQYLINYRLRHAVTLLKENPNLNITELSYNCGFNSSSYFGKCFKKYYGVTPMSYKDKLTQ